MNIILIGMPGCGKSTCGVLLAKILCKSFLDTDLLIQQNERMKLQEIMNSKGTQYFSKCEESIVSSLYTRDCVVATGGSVVYSQKAMSNLKTDGVIVYLHISYKNMKKRIYNPQTRGISLKDGFTLRDMYDERLSLYKKYADITVECDNSSVEDTVAKIIKSIGEYKNGIAV